MKTNWNSFTKNQKSTDKKLNISTKIQPFWNVLKTFPNSCFVTRVESGHRKNIEKPIGGIEIIFRKKFSPPFLSPQYPSELQSNLHNLNINSTLKYMNILHQEWASKNCRAMSSGPRKFSTPRWVGREKFSRKKSFEPDPPLP